MTTHESAAEARVDFVADSGEALVSEVTQSIAARASLARRRVKDRGWVTRRALATADLIALTFAFGFSLLLLAGTTQSNHVSDGIELAIFAVSLPFWIFVANLYGLYASDDERTDHSTADDLVGVFHLITVGTWLLYIFVSFTGVANPSMQRLVSFWLFAVVLVTTARAVARVLVRRSQAFVQNTVIVGAGVVGQLVAHKVQQHPEYGIAVVGFVDADPMDRANGVGRLPVLGAPDELPGLVRRLDIDRVIVAFSNDPHDRTLEVIRALDGLDVRVDIVPRLFEVLGTDVGVYSVEGVPLLGLPLGRLPRSSLLMKRAFDVAFAAALFLILSPFLALIVIAIRLDSRGPALFRQVRMGAGGNVFSIYKFRTMTVDADERKQELEHLSKHADGDSRMFKIPNDPRVTRVGALIRRYSLDELPQLINVLRGEMSIVGPRPLILEEDRFVVDWRRRRLNLKPGITGLWQVLGRDGIPFDEMVRLDYVYVASWSVFNDMKLILRTIPVLFRPNVC